MLNQKLHEEIYKRYDFIAGQELSLSPLTSVLDPEEVHR
jgi:hypothetical protein